ncbi:unnamed protein product [Peniophora sp. CBMAI 1063]|nr:unnamed protein product [Peniophora sp. CBMAI 1063]
MANPYSQAHTSYIRGLYRRMLKNELDWVIRWDLWRPRALAIRAQFEQNRNVRDPRALAKILEKAEAELKAKKHLDPVIPSTAPGGTKWERNLPPPRGHTLPLEVPSWL